MRRPGYGFIIGRFLTGIRLVLQIFWRFYRLKLQSLFKDKAWIALRREALYVQAAREFCGAAAAMGGLLIKLGQVLSSRVDLLPRSVLSELAHLQDEVAPVALEDVTQAVEAEFARPLLAVFSFFDATPLASASLGQVHRAGLISGEEVAVKVMRPYMETIIAVDLTVLAQAVRLIKLFTDWANFIDIDRIHSEINETFWRELDYLQEGRSAELIAANCKSDHGVRVPKIYWAYTTRRVLTMEYMQGVKITDYEALQAIGVDRRALAAQLIKLYVGQILVDGFFHADPHPGNLFVDAQGRLILLDFGMTGSITTLTREILAELVVAAVRRDYLQVVHHLKRLNFLLPGADNESVGKVVGQLIEHLLGDERTLTDAALREFIADLETMLYEQPFQLPASYVFLGRALGTVYGLCLGLDAEFKFLDEAKPYLLQFSRSNESVWQEAMKKSMQAAVSLLELPPLAERLLRRAERGELSVRVPLTRLEEHLGNIVKMLQALVWSVLAGGMTIACAYLYVHGFEFEAKSGAALLLLLILCLLRRERVTKRRFFNAGSTPKE